MSREPKEISMRSTRWWVGFLVLGAPVLGILLTRQGAEGAPPDVPEPFGRIVDELEQADTMFLYAMFRREDYSAYTPENPLSPGAMYFRMDANGRFAADVEGIGRVLFDGSEVWFDSRDILPPQRWSALDVVARDLVPHLKSGMPGSTWRRVTQPEPGLPDVQGVWAEVTLPFFWASAMDIYIRVNTDGVLRGVRVVDAATHERWFSRNWYSEVTFGGLYWDVVLEPDLHVKQSRTLLSHGRPVGWRGDGADDHLLYHERLTRTRFEFDPDTSDGSPYPREEEGPKKQVGPLVCAGPAPQHVLPFSFVWAPETGDPRLLEAQAESDDGCALRLQVGPASMVTLAGGVRARLQGQAEAIDTTSMITLEQVAIDLQTEGPAEIHSRQRGLDFSLPAGIDLAALRVEVRGNLRTQCLGPSVPEDAASWFGVVVRNPERPLLTWDHCGEAP